MPGCGPVPPRWSALTERVARAAGWYPGRAVPVGRWEGALLGAGVRLHDAATRFLGEFGGLRTDTWTPGPVMPQSPFRFDPGAGRAELERFARISGESGADLCPVGLADGGESVLAVAVDGTVHIGTDRPEPLADDAYAAIEELVMERHTAAPLPFVLDGDHLVFPRDPEQDRRPEIGTRWSAETDWALRRGGWRPGREVSTADWERRLREDDEGFVMHEAARRFLGEFGGLEIVQRGPGRTMARSPFRLDPLAALYESEIFDDLSEQAGERLYPLGSVDGGVAYLCMAPTGAVFTGMDDPYRLAGSGDEALNKLIEGSA
ncbi:SUKH-3 domain-containing protein [Streptomyces sp. NPDC008317]|uniref:SUKH-3 domain-containing protein n=1 Tax=Streptomyces sp. NPDC008317 TaxID=3364827 RepID=UPI0036F0D8AB